MKKILSLITSLCIFLSLFGCSEVGELDDTKVYSDNGMSITLPNSFYKKELASVTNYYESEDAIVTALKESLTDLETIDITSDSSLEDYTKKVLENNNLDSEIYTGVNENYMYFTYEKETSGKDFYYMGVTYKSDDAFWLLNFACVDSNKSKYSDTFLTWANTVEFD
jgi:hypothetical protein